MTTTYRTVATVAALFGVSESTVLSWIRGGELAATNTSRNSGSKKPRWRISTIALAAFEALRTPTPTAPQARRPRRPRPTDVIQFYK